MCEGAGQRRAIRHSGEKAGCSWAAAVLNGAPCVAAVVAGEEGPDSLAAFLGWVNWSINKGQAGRRHTPGWDGGLHAQGRESFGEQQMMDVRKNQQVKYKRGR